VISINWQSLLPLLTPKIDYSMPNHATWKVFNESHPLQCSEKNAGGLGRFDRRARVEPVGRGTGSIMARRTVGVLILLSVSTFGYTCLHVCSLKLEDQMNRSALGLEWRAERRRWMRRANWNLGRWEAMAMMS